MDGINCTFDEFVTHLKKHMLDIHSEVIHNDRLYIEKDYSNLKAVVVEAASKMERNISKLHLLFSNMTVDALIPLMKDIETVFITVIQSARLFMSCGLTLAAKKEVIACIDSINEAMINLVDHCKDSYKNKRLKLSPPMTGAVWDACKRLTKISESNKKACTKEALRYVSIARDICKECKEFLANEDDWDDLIDSDDLTLSDGEDEVEDEIKSEKVQISIVDLIQSLQSVFINVFQLYSNTLPEHIPMSNITIMDSISQSMSKICDNMNKLGVMLYGAEDGDYHITQQINQNVSQLMKLIQSIFLCEETELLITSLNECQTRLSLLSSLLSCVYYQQT